MSDTDLVERVEEVLSIDPAAFRERVRDDAAALVDRLDSGAFDNPQAIVGLEVEFYGVEADGRALARVPRRLLEYVGFEKELGLHNAELNTSPQPLNAAGLRAQEAEVESTLRAAAGPAAAEDITLVCDGMWTIPPRGEPAGEYLADSATVDGIRVASNMSASARYHAMAAPDRPATPRMALRAPNVDLRADTVMPESLITSIQPHYQVPRARDLPRYFGYALRVAGPLLALGVNAPLFPPDLYDEDAGARQILADARMEERIRVFEDVLNDPDAAGKVRFPRDVDAVETAVQRIVEDPVTVPVPVEETDRFDDAFAAFRAKHGTYWRWVRPVFEGATRSSAHARIEFRPLPGQPTVRDVVSFQAAFAGLLESLPRLEHPVGELEWETARENFYAAARDGLAADLEWITADGERTVDPDVVFDELLSFAREGLLHRGLEDGDAERYLRPLRERVRHRATPADWKLRRVRRRLDDGEPFAGAVGAAQRAYVDRQEESRFDGSFADWIDDDACRANRAVTSPDPR